RAARTVREHLVSGDEARTLSPFLRRVLRHAALGHDRRDRGDGAERVPGVAERRRRRRIARVGRREAVSGSRLQQLPSARRAGPGARARRGVRKARHAAERRDGDRRRSVRARIDPAAGGQGDRRLPADHADVSGARDRGAAARARRVRQIAPGAAPGADKVVMASSTLLIPPHHYLNDGSGIKSWLLTRDHKRIALLYLAGVTLFFFVGGAMAVLIRIDLATPAGDLVTDETYNKLFTMHGVMMVFFFLIPAIPAVLGNFLVPIMIGAKDLAFPKLNLFSWYIYMVGGLFTLYALVSGGVDTGWTFYTPFSTVASTTNVIPTALGIFITGFSSILTGLNFIVTIHR